MRRVAGLMLTVLTVLTSACGVRPTGIVGAGDPPVAGAPNIGGLVYLVKDGKLVSVVRLSVPKQPWSVIRQLGVGPTPAERKRGLTGKTKDFAEVFVSGAEAGVVTVIMDTNTPPRKWSRLTQAQIACTAAAIPGLKGVELNALDADAPLKVNCDQFRDLMR